MLYLHSMAESLSNKSFGSFFLVKVSFERAFSISILTIVSSGLYSFTSWVMTSCAFPDGQSFLAQEARLSLFNWATFWKESTNCIFAFSFFFTAFAHLCPCLVTTSNTSFSFAGSLLAKSGVRASSSPYITMCAWYLIFHIRWLLPFFPSHWGGLKLLETSTFFCFCHVDFTEILRCCHFHYWSLIHPPKVSAAALYYKVYCKDWMSQYFV